MHGGGLLFPGLLLPFIAGMAWSHWRLHTVVAKRHPSAFSVIESMSRSLPPKRRTAARVVRYSTLNDPEIDRLIRNCRRMELLAFIAFPVAFVLAPMLGALRLF